MKKLFIITLSMSILGIYVGICHTAQYWAKAYDMSKHNSGDCVQQTKEGGYIVAGVTTNYDDKDADIYLLKLENNGDITWLKIYGGGDAEIVNFLQQTVDGGYILTGGIRPTLTYDFYDIPVIKLDRNGSISWQKIFRGGNSEFAKVINQTNDGGYIVAGFTNSFGIGDMDIWLIKLDKNGNVSWEKTYGGSNEDLAHSIQQTSDGGYIISGETQSFGAGKRDIWILKVNDIGVVSWQKTYGGRDDDYAYSIQQTSEGDYVVAGVIDYKTDLDNYKGDIVLLNLKSNGDVAWQKIYKGSGTEIPHSIKKTTDGGYIIASLTSYSMGTSHTLLLKLDSKGDVVWERFYQSIIIDSIQQTSDGGYIMTAGNPWPGDSWVLKLDAEGNIPDCEIISSSNVEISNASFSGVDTNVIPQSTSASIVDTNLAPQEYSAEIITLCEGDNTTTSTITIPTTTTACIDPCCTEQIYGEYSEEAELLRYFRDNILNQTTEGQEIIKLYYMWNPIVVEAMEKDEEFKEDVKEIIDEIIPLVEESIQ